MTFSFSSLQEGRDAKSLAKAKEWVNSSDEEDGAEGGGEAAV